MTTVDQLRNWRPDALSGTSGALRRDTAGLDVLAERIAATTGPQLQQSWEGRAATGATQLGATRRGEVIDFAVQVSAAGQILGTAADRISEAQAQLRRAEAAAADARLSLAPDGTATPLPDPAAQALAAAEGAALVVRREAEAQAVTRMAQAALAAADEADRDAATALSNLPQTANLATMLGAALFPLLAGGPLQALLAAGLVPGVMLAPVPPAGATPRQVAAWWAGLSPEQQRLQLRANPDRIGTLDGLPANVRHEANMLVLRRELGASEAEVASLQAEVNRLREEAGRELGGLAGPLLGGLGIGFLSPAQQRLRAAEKRLGGATRRLETLKMVDSQVKGSPDRSLMLLDMNGEPRAAIGIGKVDEAKHVAVVVPGLNQDVREEMDSIVSNAQRLKFTADQLSLPATGGEDIATVAWLGYDTPNWAEVPSAARAEAGAQHLQTTLEGLEAARESARATAPGATGPEPLHLSVVGHSYGSTTSGIALHGPTPVDDVAFIGSPGVGAEHVSELRVPDGHVFVGEARQDIVADLGRFGLDPSNDDFSAREFQTSEGTDPLTGANLKKSTGHSQYFELKSSSVYNLAYITLGRGDLITPGASNGIGDQLTSSTDVFQP